MQAYQNPKEFDELVMLLYTGFNLDSCLKNKEHKVEKVAGNQVFYCKECDNCYGLDDSCLKTLLNEICNTRYVCEEKCNHCGNNDPELLHLYKNTETWKLTCLNCNSKVCSGEGNESIKNTEDPATEQTENDESFFECIKCRGKEYETFEEDGKLLRVECLDCGWINNFNEWRGRGKTIQEKDIPLVKYDPQPSGWLNKVYSLIPSFVKNLYHTQNLRGTNTSAILYSEIGRSLVLQISGFIKTSYPDSADCVDTFDGPLARFVSEAIRYYMK